MKDVKLEFFENELIMGIDEAGRGPLAGPVVVAGVIMPREREKMIEGINDSKKLSPKKREELYKKITDAAVAFYVAEIDNKIIDQINILEATKRGVYECVQKISVQPDIVYIDGNMKFPHLTLPYKSIIGGDGLIYSIACASILAKVHRDRLMSTLGERYEMYKFETHKGYPTSQHYELIEKYGASDIHRKSFL